MFDSILDLVKSNAGDLIVKNQEVPNEHNEAAINETANVIQDQMKAAFAKGNLQDIFALMGQNQQAATPNPLTGNMITNLTQQLQSKFGVNASAAPGIAGQLLPKVLAMFSQKTNDPNDKSIDMNSIIKALGGGGAGSGGGLPGGLGGGLDFNELLKKFNGGGGLDLGGLFK